MSNDAGARPQDGAPPTIENRKVPVRRANTAYRNREYLLEKEVVGLMTAAAKVGRHGARDTALILVAYRHGLRVSELVSLRWDQVDLTQGLLGENRGNGKNRTLRPSPRLKVARVALDRCKKLLPFTIQSQQLCAAIYAR